MATLWKGCGKGGKGNAVSWCCVSVGLVDESLSLLVWGWGVLLTLAALYRGLFPWWLLDEFYDNSIVDHVGCSGRAGGVSSSLSPL